MKLSKLFLTAVLLCTPAEAALLGYSVILTGPQESPPNASPGFGSGTVVINTLTNMMTLHVDFTGLLGTTTASHIHSATAVPFTGTAGVATTTPSFAGFPLGVTSGTFTNTIDLTQASSYNPAFVTANGGTTATAEAALLAGIAAGEAYWNIHTSVVPGGEIRGFLVADAPEPGTLGIAAGALLGLFAIRRKR
jgi:hypothetical protein